MTDGKDFEEDCSSDVDQSQIDDSQQDDLHNGNKKKSRKGSKFNNKGKQEEEELFAEKSIQQLLALRYPKNKFKIHLPSLMLSEIKEKRKAKQGILKEPGEVVKVLDSEKRQLLQQKIKAFKQGKIYIRGSRSKSPPKSMFRFGNRSRYQST